MNSGHVIAIFLLLNIGIFLHYDIMKQKYGDVIMEIDKSEIEYRNILSLLRQELGKQKVLYEKSKKHLANNFGTIKQLFEENRRNLIRIKGIPETEDENVEEKVLELIEYIGLPISPRDVIRANRIGVKKKTMERQIVAELSRFKLKLEVLEKSAITLMFSNILIQDDVTSYVIPGSLLRPVDIYGKRECLGIATVGKQISSTRSRVMFGAWLHDTTGKTNTTRGDAYWILPNFHDNNIVEEYANLRDLKQHRIRTKYKLPYQWAGTGHVVYNGSLYFTVLDTNIIVCYNFDKREVTNARNVTDAAVRNIGAYQWSGSTDIDLAVDEVGMWVIYATVKNSLDIVISRLDPNTLELIGTWRTNWRKQWCGNAFMACGILYTLKKYDEIDTSLGYSYDTLRNVSMHINIPITNNYEMNSMMTYSPRDHKIYAWDRGYLSTYDVIFVDH